MSSLPRFATVPSRRSMVIDPPMSDEEFEAFCLRNRDVNFERTSEGEIRMDPPTGAMTGDGNSEINHQLRGWWDTHLQGRVYDNNTGFFLPDGSMLSPDAAYVLPAQLKGLKRSQLTGFLRLCPAFVVELLSPTDSLAETRRKMRTWIANGAQLGWLIDPDRHRVIVFEPEKEPLEFTAQKLNGSGPIGGFSLDLSKVWRCYEVAEE